MRSVGWVVATTLGLVIGGFVLHFPGSYAGLGSWDIGAAIFGAILGFVTGVFVGLIQWVPLRLSRSAGGALLLAMGIGIGVTHAVNDGGPNSVGVLGVAVLSGLGMTAAFAGPLGERRPVALGVGFLAWTASMLIVATITNVLGLSFSQDPTAWMSRHAVDGLVVGLIWGTATAVVGLPERLSQPQPAGTTLTSSARSRA